MLQVFLIEFDLVGGQNVGVVAGGLSFSNGGVELQLLFVEEAATLLAVHCRLREHAIEGGGLPVVGLLDIVVEDPHRTLQGNV